MNQEITVEILRGGVVESRHRGAACVVDADGVVVAGWGDIEQPVFPRSAIKAFQALPLLESGAVEALGLTDAQIALACGSHSGGERHVAAARAMLQKVDLAEPDLACSAHWPIGEAAARDLARRAAEPCRLHNNCSGKHAGFLCAAHMRGTPSTGYTDPKHPIQREMVAAVEQMTDIRLSRDMAGLDGCGILTYVQPLRSLARGFARFASGQGLGKERALAVGRIRSAVAVQPYFVAGDGRFDTRVMTHFGERLFTKTGAEGVFCAAIPELGFGVAVKAEDGALRAAEALLVAVLLSCWRLDDPDAVVLQQAGSPPIRDWGGRIVGETRVAID